MLAVFGFRTVMAASMGLSQYYHLITTRLCQGHTSHEHGATLFSHLNAWTKKFLFREIE